MKRGLSRVAPRSVPADDGELPGVPLDQAIVELGQALLLAGPAGRQYGPNLWAGNQVALCGGSAVLRLATAGRLAAVVGRRLWRVDCRSLVSRYIGETERNLARVFAEARRHSWVLLFDEADALFGRRTAVSNADDRYANQEVSYLLDRAEIHRGLVILACATADLPGSVRERLAVLIELDDRRRRP